jgi:hypothetical protein
LLDGLPERWLAHLGIVVLTVLALRLVVDGFAGVLS